MLRFGTVSDIQKDAVRVIIPGKGNTVSAYIPLLANMALLPKVGQPVACIFEGEGLEKGICLGLYYNANFQPEEKFLIDRNTEIAGKTNVKDNLEVQKSTKIANDLDVSGSIHYGNSISGGGS